MSRSKTQGSKTLKTKRQRQPLSLGFQNLTETERFYISRKQYSTFLIQCSITYLIHPYQQNLIPSSYSHHFLETLVSKHKTWRFYKNNASSDRLTNRTSKGVSTCTGRADCDPWGTGEGAARTCTDRSGAIPSWNDLAVWLGRLMIHIGSDLWPPITKQQIPQVQINIPHTEVDEYLGGNKREIKGGWERFAMKKELWKKHRSWFSQGKERDIPGRHKTPAKQKMKLCSFPSI